MLHELLSALPPQQPSATLALLALAGALAGGFLWLAGARFSQWLVTLMAVTTGACLGLHVPQWFALPVSSWSTAVGGAMLMGLAGFAMFRLCVGAGLAGVLALWVALAMLAGDGLIGRLPAPALPLSIWAWLQQVWQSIPVELQRTGPFACGVAIIGALTMSVLWPRATAYFFYSMLGVSLMVVLAMAAMVLGDRIQLLRIIPSSAPAQMATLAGLVLFGATVQWRTAPRARARAASVPKQVKGMMS
jgi:hypothetical protein